jgi:hypothetical protein
MLACVSEGSAAAVEPKIHRLTSLHLRVYAEPSGGGDAERGGEEGSRKKRVIDLPSVHQYTESAHEVLGQLVQRVGVVPGKRWVRGAQERAGGRAGDAAGCGSRASWHVACRPCSKRWCSTQQRRPHGSCPALVVVLLCPCAWLQV